MNELLKNLTSASWWISVVVVGVLVSLASAYIKPVSDKYLSKISTRWKERTEKATNDRLRQVEIIKSNPHLQLLLALSSINAFHKCVLELIIACGAFFLGNELMLYAEGGRHMRYVIGSAVSLGVGVSLFTNTMIRWRWVTKRNSLLSDATLESFTKLAAPNGKENDLTVS